MARCPVFMIAGNLAAYFLGLLIEYEWGSHEPDRLPGPLFLFSLGVLGARDVGDQTKSGHTKCVLVGSRRRTVVLRPARRRHGERWLRPNVNKPADLVRSKS